MTVSADHPSRTHRREWRALREAVLARAESRCEVCRVPNHRPISRHRDDPGHYKLLDTGDEFNGQGQELPAQRLSEYDGLPGVGVVPRGLLPLLATLPAPGARPGALPALPSALRPRTPPADGGQDTPRSPPHPPRSRTVTPIPLAAYLADPCPAATLWGPPEGESLHAQDIDEAIDDILADYDEPPETIEVAGLRRMTVPASDFGADRILERVMEPIDEEFGDAESPMDDRITPAMRAAAEAFGEVLRREYVPWSCEEVVRVEVDVAAWLAANPASDL